MELILSVPCVEIVMRNSKKQSYQRSPAQLNGKCGFIIFGQTLKLKRVNFIKFK